MFKIGDAALIGCDSSFCNTTNTIVTEILIRYNKITGERYNIIICDDWEFDERTLTSIKVPFMYSIEKL